MTALARPLEPATTASLLREHAEKPSFLDISCDISAQPVDLGTLWERLVSATWTISETFFSDNHCYALLRPSCDADETARRMPPHQLAVLERVLLTGSQKKISIDEGTPPSTIASHCRGVLNRFGLPCACSRVPLIVVMALHAFLGLTPRREARSSKLVHCGQGYQVIYAARPDACLAGLSPSQSDVLRRLVEGKSHATIARERRTAMRTVANQLAAVFNRLGVSGRCDLLRYLARLPIERSVTPQADARHVSSVRWA